MTPPAGERFAELVKLVRILRSPEGCPWDRAQTLATLRPFVLEETYEVLEAIDRGDRQALRDELGDFVFEAVLLAELCSETGDFTMADSLAAINAKLVRRHPHVFGRRPEDASSPAASTLPTSAAEVAHRWEELKAQERSTASSPSGALGDLPRALPALLRANIIGHRAAAVNFDWARAADVLEKVREELDELQQAVAEQPPEPERIEEEMGDLLFALANLARKLGVEPESALRAANEKFLCRFAEMERRIAESGRQLRQLSLEELDQEWQKVKHNSFSHEDTKRPHTHEDTMNH